MMRQEDPVHPQPYLSLKEEQPVTRRTEHTEVGMEEPMTPHKATGPGEDAHTMDQKAANQTPTMDPVEPDPEEDTDADRKLRAVYGDTIHRNESRHSDGGIANDAVWQARYNVVVSNLHQLYLPHQGKIGAEVMSLMVSKLRGICKCKLNSERPLILMACILCRKHGCVKAKEVKKCIATCINLCHQGKYDALIQDVTNTSLAHAGYRFATNDAETAAWKYHSAVLDGQLHAAVHGLTSCDTGGVLGPDDACTKTGRHV